MNAISGASERCRIAVRVADRLVDKRAELSAAISCTVFTNKASRIAPRASVSQRLSGKQWEGTFQNASEKSHCVSFRPERGVLSEVEGAQWRNPGVHSQRDACRPERAPAPGMTPHTTFHTVSNRLCLEPARIPDVFRHALSVKCYNNTCPV